MEAHVACHSAHDEAECRQAVGGFKRATVFEINFVLARCNFVVGGFNFKTLLFA